jgi:hypothetical protein
MGAAALFGVGGGTAAADPKPSTSEDEVEIRSLVGAEIFAKICLREMPNAQAMRDKITQRQGDPISEPKAAKDLINLLAIDQIFEAFDVKNLQVDTQAAIVDPDASRAFGKGIGASVYVIEADINLGRLLFCGVAVPDADMAHLKQRLTDMLGRDAEYEVIANLRDTPGEQTKWLNWNTSGGATKVIWVGLGVPWGTSKDSGSALHLGAAGLIPRQH